jgi:hypothetical protein
MSDKNLHSEEMQAAEPERFTNVPYANSQSAECSSVAYYRSLRESPRTWTCTATFSPCFFVVTAVLGGEFSREPQPGSPTCAIFA